MTIDLLTQDKDTGYAEIELHLNVHGEIQHFRQNVMLPVNDDAKMRSILKSYGEEYEASLNNVVIDTPLVEDVTADPSLGTRLKEVGQAIKRIF